jgi:hypothetical protein
MFTTSIDLNQFADIAAAMTISATESHGLMLVHRGSHPDYGECLLTQCDGAGLLSRPMRG